MVYAFIGEVELEKTQEYEFPYRPQEHLRGGIPLEYILPKKKNQF